MTNSQIATELNISERVARKWGQIIKRGSSLEPRMGRPPSGLMGAFDVRIGRAIDVMRPGLDGWGARTLKVELERDTALSGLKKPSIRSIDNYLKSQKRTRPKHLVVPLPSESVLASRHAHDVWQLDAEGNKLVKGVGMVSPVNIGDVFSKAYVGCYPFKLAGNFSHLSMKDYQFALRIAFLEFGLCNHLQLDHESVFYDNNNQTPFPTPFHLWLLGLGVNVFFTPKGKPFKQGGVERKHQTMHRQVCADREFDGQQSLFVACQERRHRLNHEIPCRTLYDKPPFSVFPEAAKPYRPYKIETEGCIFDRGRIDAYLHGLGKWTRIVSASNAVYIGGFQYYLKDGIPNTTAQIRFDPDSKCFVCSNADDKYIGKLIPKGLSFKELSGQLDLFADWAKQNAPILRIEPD